MLCNRRRALPKRRAKKIVALCEVAVAAAGHGGRRVLATAFSNLCLTVNRRSCNKETCSTYIKPHIGTEPSCCYTKTQMQAQACIQTHMFAMSATEGGRQAIVYALLRHVKHQRSDNAGHRESTSSAAYILHCQVNGGASQECLHVCHSPPANKTQCHCSPA